MQFIPLLVFYYIWYIMELYIPDFSRTRRPEIVEPEGEHTESLRSPGCRPEARIWAADP